MEHLYFQALIFDVRGQNSRAYTKSLMHAGWSPKSQVHLKYEHWFGNESSQSLLEAYGIIPKDEQSVDVLRPKQCPNCNEPNKPDSRFCANCRMVLTYDAYSETVQENAEKERKLRL